MTTHKKSSDGGEGDDGEDTVKMWVKTKILSSNGRLCSYCGHNECAPSSIPSFLKELWTVSLVPGTALSAQDKGEAGSHGAER